MKISLIGINMKKLLPRMGTLVTKLCFVKGVDREIATHTPVLVTPPLRQLVCYKVARYFSEYHPKIVSSLILSHCSDTFYQKKKKDDVQHRKRRRPRGAEASPTRGRGRTFIRAEGRGRGWDFSSASKKGNGAQASLPLW
jgi:hypothetical protein